MPTLLLLATMASLIAGPTKATYHVAKPVVEVQRCFLLNSDRETREVADKDGVMIGFAALSRFYAVASLSASDGGTMVQLRGNGLTDNEKTCVAS
jgi:hypothetical protein